MEQHDNRIFIMRKIVYKVTEKTTKNKPNMKFHVLLLILLAYKLRLSSATCQFTTFQGADYALVEVNTDWFTANSTCDGCGAVMMGMPSVQEKPFVDQTLAANVAASSYAWVNLRTDYWCSFYTIKSGKQFSGTNCLSNLQYVLCKK